MSLAKRVPSHFSPKFLLLTKKNTLRLSSAVRRVFFSRNFWNSPTMTTLYTASTCLKPQQLASDNGELRSDFLLLTKTLDCHACELAKTRV
jgi:hypothetical protein